MINEELSIGIVSVILGVNEFLPLLFGLRNLFILARAVFYPKASSLFWRGP